ncbi:MAG: RHS repeat-associated core domain-containing protein [Phycisphaerae bacterium]
MGRRVEKRVSTYSGGAWSVTSVTRFVYDGWRLIEELDCSGGTGVPPVILRKYTWGLDLAGLNGSISDRDSAGGIGGLLSVYDTNGTTSTADDKTYLYQYDGNGNVVQLVDASNGTVVAKYEYDAYGNTIFSSGGYADTNPFRFSTKYFDAESGWYYYGYRYYWPRVGRWTSRDPFYEEADIALFRAMNNCPVNQLDALGQVSKLQGCCGPDITNRLMQLLKRVESYFGLLLPSQQANLCRNIIGAYGWDVGQLLDSGRSTGFGPFEAAGCGTGTCKGTVQVNGLCFRSNEVNYILWGKAFSLCGASMHNWAVPRFVKTTDEWNIVWYDVFGRRVLSSYTCAEAAEYTILWRTFGARRQNIKPNLAGQGSAACRVAWSNFGCTGKFAGLGSHCEAQGCGVQCCAKAYKGPLSAHLGTEKTTLGIDNFEFQVP